MNLVPLQAAIKLVADATADGVKAASDTTSAAKMTEFENLIPDLLVLMPQIGTISVAGLSTSDYSTLLQNLAADLNLPASHAANVINASMKLLEDLVTVIYPDVQAVIAAVKAAPAVVTPVQPVATPVAGS